MAFDPGAVAEKNGRYFGFPYSEEEGEILILPAGWDVTTSYRDGASRGPAAVLDASPQLDFTSPYRDKAWETKIASVAPDANWLKENALLRPLAKEVINALENGRAPDARLLARVNEGGAAFHAALEARTAGALAKGKGVVTLGGDHSVALGPIRAHAAAFKNISVLHIDAHADLRVAYEGFEHSHASVMHHVARLPQVSALVQVGLRDISPEELKETETNEKIYAHFDWDIRRATARGISWDDQTRAMIAPLSDLVYISVDIDGLDPKYCPGTGTPVPGGLELWELLYLIEAVQSSGRRIVGADLMEVAPGDTEWDANVGARILFQLCQFVRNGQDH
ncbi:MAG: agmatinase family protein [Proteobacteria bacterium]|nr:MAG: agmatinase family protein [Pseudomonadota bacterium]